MRESPSNHHDGFDEPCSAHVTFADVKGTEGRAYQQKLKGEGLEYVALFSFIFFFAALSDGL